MQIEFIPGFTNPNVTRRIEDRLDRCKSLKGTVAFWTLKVGFFEYKSLLRALKREGSFYCIDLQLPTNIDTLAQYVQEGATEIFLHKYRLSPKSNPESIHLLHSKIIVFEFDDDVEIWIGSHNFTISAFTGLNVETSVAIRTSKDDKFYQEIILYLEHLKGKYCVKFDLAKIEIYKKLQLKNAEKTLPQNEGEVIEASVVTLIGINMSNLDEENFIQLLSLQGLEFSKFKTLGTKVYIHCFDIRLNKEFLYLSEIVQSGRLGNDKLTIEFTNPLRFAYIGSGTLAHLKASQKIDDRILEVAEYFVKLQILSQINDFSVFEKPQPEIWSMWKKTNKLPYFQGLNNPKGIPKYSIQEAEFNQYYQPPIVSIAKDWSYLRHDLERFYRDLDELVIAEYDIYGSKQNTDLENHLKNLLDDIGKNLSLPKYSKALVERIILVLHKKQK